LDGFEIKRKVSNNTEEKWDRVKPLFPNLSGTGSGQNPQEKLNYLMQTRKPKKQKRNQRKAVGGTQSKRSPKPKIAGSNREAP